MDRSCCYLPCTQPTHTHSSIYTVMFLPFRSDPLRQALIHQGLFLPVSDAFTSPDDHVAATFPRFTSPSSRLVAIIETISPFGNLHEPLESSAVPRPVDVRRPPCRGAAAGGSQLCHSSLCHQPRRQGHRTRSHARGLRRQPP